MKKILFIVTACFFFSLSSQSQYITIPDETLRANIQQYHPSCMNASGKMDTTCSEILNATVFQSGEIISNWQGFQYFRNLETLSIVDDVTSYPFIPGTVKYLTLQGNNLTDANFPALPAGLLKLDIQGPLHTLPPLPPGLTHLNCFGSNITTLPALPPALTTLKVGMNYLSSLPLPLPSGMDTLDCSDNGIHQQFTTLPQGLIYFNCSGNFFSSLGSSPLPPTLKYLDCSVNEALTSIPAITGNLEYLYAFGDILTSLPALPASIREINVYNNQLTSLPELPASLRILNCNTNQLASLPQLPALLGTLDCSFNQLTSLPTLNSGLHSLVCNNNNLVSLPAIPPGLTYIECQNNQLTSLPALPNPFGYLDCSHNQLTNLPILPPSHMDELWCSHNQLSYLPRLPDSLIRLVCDSNNLTCLPYLPGQLFEIQTDNSSCICIPNIPNDDCFFIKQGNYAQYLSLCNPTNNINHCQVFPSMMGYVYNDNNNNNVKDSDEPVRANVRVQFSNGTVTYTNNDGQYTMWADTIGNCNLNCSNPIYYLSLPAQYHYDFLTYDTLVVNNFALQATTVIDSMTILAEPMNWAARPGFSFPYLISYENSGTTSLTANIVFNYDNTRLIFDSVSNAAVNNTGSSLQITHPMVAGARNNFIGYFHINPAAVIGDTIFVNAHATANAVDAYDSIDTRIRGSYDPNEKTATPIMSRAQVVAGKYIDYKISFQNTGTDTAFNIVVTDTLNSLLQKETLQILNTSHLCKITQKDNIIYFEFNNILLPDSNINEQKSHGFVSFRLKPKSFVDNGTSIPNKAAIYFDYNLPVITNTAVTDIMTPAGPLPLRLISFNVMRKSKNVANVYWTTANEINVQKFFIETSIDGRNYSAIALQDAMDAAYNNYNKQVGIGDNDVIYFRLKMMDIDANFTYSPVVTLKSDKESHAFSFMSNPAKNVLTITLNDETLRNTVARIINAQGIVVKTFLLKNNPENIDIRNLPAGTYVLQTVKGSSSFVVRD